MLIHAKASDEKREHAGRVKLAAVALLTCGIFRFTIGAGRQLMIYKPCESQSTPRTEGPIDDNTTPSRESCLRCDVEDIRLPLKDEWPFRGSCPIPQISDTPSAAIAGLLGNTERCSSGRCNVWIAYVGDSLLRSPYSTLIDTMLGPEWPVGGDRNKWNLSTYHVDQRVCCRGNRSGTSNDDMRALDCAFSRGFDTIAFVRSFFRDGDTGGTDLCLSWQWNRLADGTLRDLVTNYTGIHGSTLQDDASFAPQMIAINAGLHAIMSGQTKSEYMHGIKSLLAQMSDTAAIQNQLGLVPTRYVWHDITSVIDADMPDGKRKLVNESRVIEFNAALQELLRAQLNAPDTKQWLRVLPANRLTTLGRKNGLVKALGDGVHYVGGYQRVIVGLHMYFINADAAPSFCRSGFAR